MSSQGQQQHPPLFFLTLASPFLFDGRQKTNGIYTKDILKIDIQTTAAATATTTHSVRSAESNAAMLAAAATNLVGSATIPSWIGGDGGVG